MTRGEGRALCLAAARALGSASPGLLTRHNELYLARKCAALAGIAPSDGLLRQWAREIATAYAGAAS